MLNTSTLWVGPGALKVKPPDLI
eukprot:SAG11_NODE_13679_length_643_cov_14.077206_1_plen_22_part_01